MIVIIEGPDGSGKSTLARAIALSGGLRYRHSGAPTKPAVEEYTDPALRLGGWVLDRWHLGEIVYGEAYRGACGLSDTDLAYVEGWLAAQSAVLVHCNGPVATLARRLTDRGEQVDVPQLKREADAFAAVVKRSRLPVLESPIGCELTPDEVFAEWRRHYSC